MARIYKFGSSQQPRLLTCKLGFISELPTFMPSSNHHKLGLIVINKDSVLDQPTPDLLNTTFHHTNCNLLGCATVRLETQINLCVIRVAVRMWKVIPHELE